MTISSGVLFLPSTEEEWHKLIQDVLDRRTNSYVQAALALARRFVLDERDKRELADNLSSVQSRCSILLDQRRELSRLIVELAEASKDDRDRLIDGMLTACKAMQ
jgi:hypothetical protein